MISSSSGAINTPVSRDSVPTAGRIWQYNRHITCDAMMNLDQRRHGVDISEQRARSQFQ
jgi:hypothetical protein